MHGLMNVKCHVGTFMKVTIVLKAAFPGLVYLVNAPIIQNCTGKMRITVIRFPLMFSRLVSLTVTPYCMADGAKHVAF
jgi:hypothetical protein